MTDHALVKVDHGIDAIEKMGHYIAQSGLFGMKNSTQAVALMLIAQAEGRHPASAAQDYHIIQNRPSLKTDSMLARFQQAGGKVEWITYTDAKVSGKFTHPQGGSLTVDWDMARAKQAGLGTKDNWKNYPRAMLRARVISEAIRTVYPAVLGGMYTPEEVMDFEPEPATTMPTPPPTPPQNTTAAPSDAPPDPLHQQRVDLGNMLLEMCGTSEEAGKTLEYMTTFENKDGKTIKGKTSVKALTEKQVPIVYRKVKDQFEKWIAAQQEDTPMTPADDIQLEDADGPY